jgi:hypothetical protein
MTRPSDQGDYGKQGPRKSGRRRLVGVKWRAATAFAGLVVLGAGCGGPNGPAVAGSGSSTGRGMPT